MHFTCTKLVLVLSGRSVNVILNSYRICIKEKAEFWILASMWSCEH